MFEKDLRITMLLDFYGDILTPKRKAALELYYNDDLSLSEIADEFGITRQGAHELIKCAENDLRSYEAKLGLYERTEKIRSLLASIGEQLQKESVSRNLQEQIRELADLVSQ